MSGDAFERLVRSIDTPPTTRTECESLPVELVPALTPDERERARGLLELRLGAPFPEDPRIPEVLVALGDPRSVPALRAALERARGSRRAPMLLAIVDALLAMGADVDADSAYRSIVTSAETLGEGALAAIARMGERSPAAAIPFAEHALREARTSMDRGRLLSLLRTWFGVPAQPDAGVSELSLLGQRLRSRWTAVLAHGYRDLEVFLADARRGALAPWTGPLPASDVADRALGCVRKGVPIAASDAAGLDETSKERIRLVLLEALPECPSHVLASLVALRNDEVRAALTEAAEKPWIEASQRAALRAAAHPPSP